MTEPSPHCAFAGPESGARKAWPALTEVVPEIGQPTFVCLLVDAVTPGIDWTCFQSAGIPGPVSRREGFLGRKRPGFAR